MSALCRQNVCPAVVHAGGRLTAGIGEAPPFPSASIKATSDDKDPTTLSFLCAVIGSQRTPPPATIVCFPLIFVKSSASCLFLWKLPCVRARCVSTSIGTSSSPTLPNPGASATNPLAESVPDSASCVADALGENPGKKMRLRTQP